MRTRSLLVPPTLLVAACQYEPVPTDWVPFHGDDHTGGKDGARFQQHVDTAVAAGLPGVALLVRGPHGTWSGAAGFAQIDAALPWSAATLGRAGNVTKLFASTLVLRLVEQRSVWHLRSTPSGEESARRTHRAT